MKKDILVYKDYIATIHFSTDDELFFGKIEGIDDLITFEGTCVDELKKAFEDSVEEYIELCCEADKEPLKSFKGSFNVRLNPELHKKAYRIAVEQGMSLNKFVHRAIEHEVKEWEAPYSTDSEKDRIQQADRNGV